MIRGEAGLRLSIKEGSETLFILVLRVSPPKFSNLTKNTGCVDGGELNLNEITSTTPLSPCLSACLIPFICFLHSLMKRRVLMKSHLWPSSASSMYSGERPTSVLTFLSRSRYRSHNGRHIRKDDTKTLLSCDFVSGESRRQSTYIII